MPVTTDWVSYGNHSGYLARPGRVESALPGVVVIQEIWGVDEHIQDVARRIAAEKRLDLTAVTGSGPHGRIVKADVEGKPAAPVAASTPAPIAVPAPASAPAAPAATAMPTGMSAEMVRKIYARPSPPV